MKSQRISALMMVMAFALTGCASIVGQSVFPLTINSQPNGSKILIKDEHGNEVFTGTTPSTVSLTAGESYFHAKSYSITFSKEGYADQHAVVKSEISGWYFGNILFGGLIGMLIVDPITGKMWKLPPAVSANLSEEITMNGLNQPTLNIVTIDQVPDNLREALVQIK